MCLQQSLHFLALLTLTAENSDVVLRLRLIHFAATAHSAFTVILMATAHHDDQGCEAHMHKDANTSH